MLLALRTTIAELPSCVVNWFIQRAHFLLVWAFVQFSPARTALAATEFSYAFRVLSNSSERGTRRYFLRIDYRAFSHDTFFCHQWDPYRARNHCPKSICLGLPGCNKLLGLFCALRRCRFVRTFLGHHTADRRTWHFERDRNLSYSPRRRKFADALRSRFINPASAPP